jgi:hypothetical protein
MKTAERSNAVIGHTFFPPLLRRALMPSVKRCRDIERMLPPNVVHKRFAGHFFDSGFAYIVGPTTTRDPALSSDIERSTNFISFDPRKLSLRKRASLSRTMRNYAACERALKSRCEISIKIGWRL